MVDPVSSTVGSEEQRELEPLSFETLSAFSGFSSEDKDKLPKLITDPKAISCDIRPKPAKLIPLEQDILKELSSSEENGSSKQGTNVQKMAINGNMVTWSDDNRNQIRDKGEMILTIEPMNEQDGSDPDYEIMKKDRIKELDMNFLTGPLDSQ